jgi:opacity protein-like surface antigen
VNKLAFYGVLAAGFVGLGATAHAQTSPLQEEAKALKTGNPLVQLADEPGTPPPRRRVVRQEPPPEPPPQPQPVYQPPPPPPPPSPWYFLLSAGAAFPRDTDFSVAGVAGSINYSTGFHVFGGVGYQFTPWIAVELEAGYLHLPIDGAQVGGVAVNIDGSVRAVAGFASLKLTYPEWHYMRPYIAAGPGVVHRFSTDFTATVGGATVTGDIGSETDFAAQGKAGIALRLTETIWLAPEYRFIWINTKGNGLNNTHVHSVGASLKITF